MKGFEEEAPMRALSLQLIGPLLALLLAAPVAQAQTPAEFGPRKTAVILASFTDAPTTIPPSPIGNPYLPAGTPLTTDVIRELVFTGQGSVNSYYQEVSYNRISLTGKVRPDGDVFGWFDLKVASAPSCDLNGFKALARQAAEGAGVSLSGYDTLYFIFNWSDSCPNRGLGDALNQNIGIGGDFMVGDVPTYIHELGHTLGLYHAVAATCKDAEGGRVAISAACDVDPPRDPFEQLGLGRLFHFSNWHKERLGILDGSGVLQVTESGDYSLRASLEPSTETTSLRIPRTTDANGAVEWYDLEIRKKGGAFESQLEPKRTLAQAGILIRIVSSRSYVDVTPTLRYKAAGSVLLDAVPYTESFDDAPLGVGRTVSLWSQALGVGGSEARVDVTTLSAGDGEAEVAVDVVELDTVVPTRPQGVSASSTPAGVELTWEPSFDFVGVTGYEVFRNGVLRQTVSSPRFVDESAGSGGRRYMVRARDASGHVSEFSDPLTISLHDRRAPTAPFGLRASMSRGAVDLVWDSSEDDTGVARYVVLRNGVQIGTTLTSKLQDFEPPAGTNSYVVYAEDWAGNQSATSEALVLVVPDVPQVLKPVDLLPPPESPVVDRDAPQLTISHRRKGNRLFFRLDAVDASPLAELSLTVNGRRTTSMGSPLLLKSMALGSDRPCDGAFRVVGEARDSHGNTARRGVRLAFRPNPSSSCHARR